ncbi:hypothetical protein GA047_13565 [Vibrio cholerae]|nr:hypothetical protein [Vibrio cholerae]
MRLSHRRKLAHKYGIYKLKRVYEGSPFPLGIKLGERIQLFVHSTGGSVQSEASQDVSFLMPIAYRVLNAADEVSKHESRFSKMIDGLKQKATALFGRHRSIFGISVK